MNLLSSSSMCLAPRYATLVTLVSILAAACAGPATPSATAPAVTQVHKLDLPPEWRPGDRWVYEWKIGADTGTKTVEIVETKLVNNINYYVVRIGDVDHYYTPDLHWAASVQDSKVQSRMIPPQPWFVWPLEAGRQWRHRGTYEEQGGKTPYNDTFAVAGSEIVVVPAGRFSALKVVREEAASRDSDQYWYAPEVRFYVKWIGRRKDAQFEEQLREHRPASRPMPSSDPRTPPSKTP